MWKSPGSIESFSNDVTKLKLSFKAYVKLGVPYKLDDVRLVCFGVPTARPRTSQHGHDNVIRMPLLSTLLRVPWTWTLPPQSWRLVQLKKARTNCIGLESNLVYCRFSRPLLLLATYRNSFYCRQSYAYYVSTGLLWNNSLLVFLLSVYHQSGSW